MSQLDFDEVRWAKCVQAYISSTNKCRNNHLLAQDALLMAVAQAEMPSSPQHSNAAAPTASKPPGANGTHAHPTGQNIPYASPQHVGFVDLMGVLDSDSDSDAFDSRHGAPAAPLPAPAYSTAPQQANARGHTGRSTDIVPLQTLPRNSAAGLGRGGAKSHSAPPLQASASFSSTEGGAAATAAAAATTRRYTSGLTGAGLAAPRSRVFRGGSKWASADRRGGATAPATVAGTPVANKAVAPVRPPVIMQSPSASLLDISAEAPPAPPPSLPVAPNPWAAAATLRPSAPPKPQARRPAHSPASSHANTPPSSRARGGGSGGGARILSASPLKSQGSPPPPAVQYNGLLLPGLSERTRNTWVFPVHEKYAERTYQRAIVQTALFQNTLVSLPTGLGKTFIASVVMYNFFRWFPAGQVVFLAPTKPLVVQQVEACHKITGLPASATAVLCGGSVKPEQRTRVWEEKRVVFATPQTLAKDLEAGRAAPERITLLVLDEAHRAQGGYAYCSVVRFMFETHDRARILALSATPGRDAATVQAVVENLRISAVEARTEFDTDVAPYTHAKTIDKVTVPSSAELDGLLTRFQACLKPNVARLAGAGLLPVKDPKRVSGGMLRDAEAAMWAAAKAGRMDDAECADAKSRLAVLHSLVPPGKELGTHCTYAFWTRVQRFLRSAPDSPGRAALTSHPQWRMLCSQLASLDAGGRHLVHPKLLVLRNTLQEHFARAAGAGKSTRAIVFTQTRASVDEIIAYLKRKAGDTIHAAPFVGQASSGSGSSSGGAGGGGGAGGSAQGVAAKGQSQREQAAVIAAFRAGTTNTLIATCIGEEGLDIGEVGIIVMFDAVGSPIRTVQRLGRTGRSGAGACVALVAPGAEARKFDSAFKEYRRVAAFLKDAASRLRMWQAPSEGGAGGLKVTDGNGKQPPMERRSLIVAALHMSQVQGGDAVGGGRGSSAAAPPDTPTAAEADFLAQWMGKGTLDPPTPLLQNGRLAPGVIAGGRAVKEVAFAETDTQPAHPAAAAQNTPFRGDRRRIATPATVPRPQGRTPQPSTPLPTPPFAPGAIVDLASSNTPPAAVPLPKQADEPDDDDIDFDDDVLLQLVGAAEGRGGAAHAAAPPTAQEHVSPPSQGLDKVNGGYALRPPYYTDPEHAARTRLWRDCLLHGGGSLLGGGALAAVMQAGRRTNGPTGTPPGARGVILSLDAPPRSAPSQPGGASAAADSLSASGPTRSARRRRSSLSSLLVSFADCSSSGSSSFSARRPAVPTPTPGGARGAPRLSGDGVIQILDDDSDGSSPGTQLAASPPPPAAAASPPLPPIQWPDSQASDEAGLDFQAADLWLTQAARAPESLQNAVHPPPSLDQGGAPPVVTPPPVRGAGVSDKHGTDGTRGPIPAAALQPAAAPNSGPTHGTVSLLGPRSPPLAASAAPPSAGSSLLGAGLSSISAGGPSASGASSSVFSPAALALLFPQNEADAAVGGVLGAGAVAPSASSKPHAIEHPHAMADGRCTSLKATSQAPPMSIVASPDSPLGAGTPPQGGAGGAWGGDSPAPSPIPLLGTQTQRDDSPVVASPPLVTQCDEGQEGGGADPPAPPLHATGTIFAATADSSAAASEAAPATVAAVSAAGADDSLDDSVVLAPPRLAAQGGARVHREASDAPAAAAATMHLLSDGDSGDSGDASVVLPGGPHAHKLPEASSKHKHKNTKAPAKNRPGARNRFMDVSAEAEGGSEDEEEGGSANEYDLDDSFIHKSSGSQGGMGGSQVEVSINHAALNAELDKQGGTWGRMFGSRAGPMPVLAAALAAAEAEDPPTPPRRVRRKSSGGKRSPVGGRRRRRAAVVSDSDTSGDVAQDMAPPRARKLPRGPTSDDSDSFIVHDVTAASDSPHGGGRMGASTAGGGLHCSFGGGPGRHHGFACDGCGLSPIVGTRFTCTVCAEFDLCEKCMPHKVTLHDLAISGASDEGPPHPFRAVAAPSGSPHVPPSAPTSSAVPQGVGASGSTSSGSDAFELPQAPKGGQGGLNTSSASGGSSGSVFDPLPPPAPPPPPALADTLPPSAPPARPGAPPTGGAGGRGPLDDDSDEDLAPAAAMAATAQAQVSKGDQQEACDLPAAAAADADAADAAVSTTLQPTQAVREPEHRVYIGTASGEVCNSTNQALSCIPSIACDTAWGDVGAVHGVVSPHEGWLVWSRRDLVRLQPQGLRAVLDAALASVPSVSVFLTELPGTNIAEYMCSAQGAECAAAISALRTMGPAGVRVLVKRSPTDVAAAIEAAAAGNATPLPPLPRLTAPPGVSHPPPERKLAAQARFLQQRKGLPPAVAVVVASAAQSRAGGLTALLAQLAQGPNTPLAKGVLGGGLHWRQTLCTLMQ